MTVAAPPWEGLTGDDVSRRLAAMNSPPPFAFAVRRSFGRDAVVSTGSAAIDELMPGGGITCGSIFEIFGPPAAGKSRLVRQMVAAFVARGSVEWAPKSTAANNNNNNNNNNNGTHGCQQLQEGEEGEEEDEETKFRPRDWCVFFLYSDPSSVSPRHIHEALKKSIIDALANSVQCVNDRDALLQAMMTKVKFVHFTSPNDLLSFFRFLNHVEYVASQHHARRRRVLVVVDSLARLWDHPMCGGTIHARHWMAASLVREVRNAIVVGNGWRNITVGNSGEFHNNSNNNNNNNNNNNAHDVTTCGCGSLAVVFVNGCASMYHRNSPAPGPLGVPVWWASGADVRLFVEPISGVDVLQQQSECVGKQTATRVRLVKGGRELGRTSWKCEWVP